MAHLVKDCYLVEKSNKPDKCLEAFKILLKMLNNIISEPDNEKYRSIRLQNKVIKEKLLSISKIETVLHSIGFKPTLNGAEYKMTAHIPHSDLKQFCKVFASRIAFLSSMSFDGCGPSNDDGRRRNEKILPTRPYRERISFHQVLTTHNQLLRLLELHSDSVMQYEDEQLLNVGRNLIPIDNLTERASENLIAIQEKMQSGKWLDAAPCIRDLILIELANWFHCEFFEWVNNLPCSVCNRDDSSQRRNGIENGVRVEIGFCCGKETKFYRYNDVADLLSSRRGRCGEYANCFTFLCRCLDYEARMVVATFDHVWTEVYSEERKQWIHVDPSDNIYDCPLIYQHGWKRNVDYIFAYSKDEVQDVTWRYTSEHRNTLKNRTKCSEKELVESIAALRNKRQRNLSNEEKRALAMRTLTELIELSVERQVTENDLKGRSSGSLAWRAARGEHSFDNKYTFEANSMEATQKQFNLRYNCARDEYQRYISILDKHNHEENIIECYKTWQSVAFSSRSVLLKKEHDWKMVYIAREEGSDSAEIAWKFDFSKQGLVIKDYKLKLDSKTFENGSVDVSLIPSTESPSIVGCSSFVLKVYLSGGKGDCSWQHSQLFRQKLNSEEFPFELNVEFE